MTFEDLISVHNINIEIKKVQEEIQQLREQNFFKPNIISDMPRGGTGKDMLVEYVEESKKLDDILNYSLRKLQEKRAEIEEFICGIEDHETRLIVRLRCINNMDWVDIGAELSMSRTTASIKYSSQNRFCLSVMVYHLPFCFLHTKKTAFRLSFFKEEFSNRENNKL